MDTIEIKIKYKGDNTKWESIPVFGEYFKSEWEVLKPLLEMSEIIQEIRWNYQGSSQGHYCFGLYASFF